MLTTCAPEDWVLGHSPLHRRVFRGTLTATLKRRRLCTSSILVISTVDASDGPVRTPGARPLIEVATRKSRVTATTVRPTVRNVTLNTWLQAVCGRSGGFGRALATWRNAVKWGRRTEHCAGVACLEERD